MDVISVYCPELEDYENIDTVIVEMENGDKITLPYKDSFEVGGIEYRITYVDCCGYWFFEAIEPNLEDEEESE